VKKSLYVTFALKRTWKDMSGMDAREIAGNLSAIFYLPGVQGLLRGASAYCEACGRSHLELALEEFSGEKVAKRCVKGRMVSAALQMALTAAGSRLKVEKEAMKKGLRDPWFRKGLASTVRGLFEFGLNRPFTPGAPFLVVWNLTNACNLTCRHCYQGAGRAMSNELTPDEKVAVVEEMAREGVVSVAFSGGEPLMASGFWRAAQRASELGIYVSLATNGSLIGRETAERLKRAGVGYVQVSVDGSTPAVHDMVRGLPGSFERAVRGISNLVEAGVETCIAFTAMKVNYDEVPRVVELAKKLGLNRVIVFNWIPAGRGGKNLDDDITPERREELLKYLYRLTTSGEVIALSTAPQFGRVSLEMSEEGVICPTHFASYPMPGETARLAGFIGGCGAGRLYCAIQPDGKVTPCVFMPSLVVGDLRRERFSSIWRENEVLRSLRDRSLLRGPCGDCQFKMECGGCRARALGYTGDILESDPGCVYVQQMLAARDR